MKEMQFNRFNILIVLVLIGGIGLVYTMAQAAPWCRTIAAQTVPGGPDICMSLVLTDAQGNPKDTFAVGEPVFARISMENVGASSIVSSKSFTDSKFPLFLLFHDPDGKPITARHLSSQTPPPPPVKYIAGKPTQMDEVEILQPPWGLSVGPFNVRDFYQATKSGPYRVKLLIPIITYPMAEVKTFSGKKYAKLDSANWSGELESNPVSFSILSANTVQVCSSLGDNPNRPKLDKDTWIFQGTKDEQVTITLQADESGQYTGKRATVILKDKLTNGELFLKKDRRRLPKVITVELLYTDGYKIIVREQKKKAKGRKFKGDFCLTLESSGNAFETLESRRNVEQ